MSILQKLHKIEEKKFIYDIHYCRAGIGILFYEPPKGFEIKPKDGDKWREYIKVSTYYPTFEKMIEEEYKRLTPFLKE